MADKKVTYLSLTKFREGIVSCREDEAGKLKDCQIDNLFNAERPLTVQNGVFIQDKKRAQQLGVKPGEFDVTTGFFTDLIEIDTPKGKVRILYPGGG